MSWKYSAQYKSQNFRIDAATSAALNGLSDAQIQFKGQWHSDAFKQSFIQILVGPVLQKNWFNIKDEQVMTGTNHLFI